MITLGRKSNTHYIPESHYYCDRGKFQDEQCTKDLAQEHSDCGIGSPQALLRQIVTTVLAQPGCWRN